MTATTGLRPRRVDLASCWSSTGCQSRSLNCAVRPSTQACNRHTQRPSQPSIPAAVACLSRYCSRRGPSRSFAHTFGVSQIPIAKAAAPPPTTARGFVPWRLSDAGQRVRGSVDHRRHPKPCTVADIAAPLFDRLVGTQYHRWRHSKGGRLGPLSV